MSVRKVHAMGFRARFTRLTAIFIISLTLFGGYGASGAESVPVAVAPEDPEGCYCLGRVGNVNCDYRDEVSLADITMLIDHLFISGVRLPNLEEANASGDAAGEISLSDVVALVDYLFISGTALPECPRPYNNPPRTRLVGLVNGVPFINSVAPYSSATGVRLAWEAEDLIDHAYDDPDFAFEYRLFGPYTNAELDIIESQCVQTVFCTHDGRIFKHGDFNLLIICDTTWLPGGVREISCDTVITDTIEAANEFGWLDTLLDIESSDFDPFYRVADSSGDGENIWTWRTADTLYDVFHFASHDTTTLSNFIVWVRSRDPIDSSVSDPTPAFRTIEVIDARHERDVLVLDFGITATENRVRTSSARTFWRAAVRNWIAASGQTHLVFDTVMDVLHNSNFPSDMAPYLRALLKYKVVVIFQDAAGSAIWSSRLFRETTLQAMAVGTNVWLNGRVLTPGYHSVQFPCAVETASATMQYYFGTSTYYFPGWGDWLFTAGHFGLPRTEDFVGANSLDTLKWPNLVIDTALLHARYVWEGCIPSPDCYTDVGCDPMACFPFLPFSDSNMIFLGALPQVGWVQPVAEAEVMYTYHSLYPEGHPISPTLNFDGLPVMHRVDRGIFRSVHACFTPIALEASGEQALVNSVLNWLYGLPEPGETVKRPVKDIEGRVRP